MDPFMQAAIEEAKKGLNEGGIPIGSCLVKNNLIVARGRNRRVQLGSAILHAEIDCLQNAGRLTSYKEAILYSTLMPCFLCAGAVVQFNIKKVVVGEAEIFNGAEDFLLKHGVEVVNLNLSECKEMMKRFIENNPKLWNEDIGKT